MKLARRETSGKYGLVLILLSAFLVLNFYLSFYIGRYTSIAFPDVFKILINSTGIEFFAPTWSDTAAVVMMKLRFPRVIAAMLVGAALPMAGAAYQALFANPMASPDTLGVTNGSSVGAVIGILLGFSSFFIELSAFAVGVVSVLIVYVIAMVLSKGRNMTMYLVLVGMVVSSLLSAILSILKYLCDPDNQLPAITYWLMGSFNSVDMLDVKVYCLFFLAGAIPLFMLRWRMNLLSLSDFEAKSLGENTVVLRTVTILCATLLTAASVAITGGIGWVGLIIPHMARIIVGHDFRKVLPVSALLGASFLLIMDNIARSALATELPIGTLTSIIGAPIFFFILIKFRRNMLRDS